MVSSKITKLTVDKLDAAKRQMRVAIRLWFADDDPVAIHALASAAHEIIHTLFRRKGLRGLMFDTDHIKDEYRAHWARKIKETATFFKHAQRDPDASIEFVPETNDVLLTVCIWGAKRMGEPLGLEESAFAQWLFIHRPTWFTRNGTRDSMQIEAINNLGRARKPEFFQAFDYLWKSGTVVGRFDSLFSGPPSDEARPAHGAPLSKRRRSQRHPS